MQKFGLLGAHLGHSFSRAYFTDKFRRLGLDDYRYDNYELADVSEASRLFADPELRGLNVTIPYKQAILPLLDAVDPAAREIGAVNTIALRGGRATGYNTDVHGFTLALKPYLVRLQTAAPALVLGTGGAARAVAWVLAKAGLPHYLVSRHPTGEQLGYRDLERLDWDGPRLVVNATPLGTSPRVDECPPMPVANLGPGHVVIDLVYNPAETLLLRYARERGAATCNGLTMLHGQAEAAWTIWRDARPESA